MDPELRYLFYRRAKAEYEVDIDIGNLVPLLLAGPEKTNSLVSRIDDAIIEIGVTLGGFQDGTWRIHQKGLGGCQG